jgi:glycerol-3-phosphate dehydrogenase
VGGPSLGPLLQAFNLVFDGPWPLGERLGVGARGGNRFLFLVPWRDRLLAGTEYTERPPGREGIDRFRGEVSAAFPWARLADRSVVLVHHGLVPGGPEGQAMRPRFVDHEAEGGPAGLVTVQGVKYTTARAVAERAVVLACAKLGRSADRPPVEGPLPWARPLDGPLAERTRIAVKEEMARTLADAMLRRLDLGTAGPPTPAEVDAVAGVMAEELAWDASRLAAERGALAAFFEAAYNGA